MATNAGINVEQVIREEVGAHNETDSYTELMMKDCAEAGNNTQELH